MAEKSRAERNNNWGNIRYVPANKWIGQVGIEPPNADGEQSFSVFDKPENSVRALALLLQTYQDRYHLRTVRGLFDRYAPPNENPTENYIAAVAKALGVAASDPVDVTQYAVAFQMIQAIVAVEMGYLPTGHAKVITEGLRRAGVVKPVTTIAQAAATPTGVSTLTITGVAAAATAVAPALQSLGGLSPWTVAILAAVALIVGAYAVLHGRKSNQALQP